MSHIMLKIDTLGVNENALVLSIGVVPFTTKSVYKPKGKLITLAWQEQINAGRGIDEPTLRYWLGQSDGARKTMLGGTGKSLKSALKTLTEVIDSDLDSDSGVWGRGGFDVAIVESLFKAAKITVPWKFYQSKDVRTALMLSEAKDIPTPKGHLKNNALSDAIHQATQVRKFLEFVENGSPGDEEESLI